MITKFYDIIYIVDYVLLTMYYCLCCQDVFDRAEDFRKEDKQVKFRRLQ